MRLPLFVVFVSLVHVLLLSGIATGLDEPCDFGEKCNNTGCLFCEGAKRGFLGFFFKKKGTCQFSPMGTCCFDGQGYCDGFNECILFRGGGGRKLQDDTCDVMTFAPTQAPTHPPTPAPATPTPAPVCPPGTDMCDDPHMKGLRGQKIDWSGVDGGWYCILKDDDCDLQINVRLTAPLPEDFPDRQLITGLSIASQGHSLSIEVTNPYDIETDGCPAGISPCIANGGLRAFEDGQSADGLLRSARNEQAADNIMVSATNLPVECRQFGGDKIWARMYDEMLQGRRRLAHFSEEKFEDWILRFDGMAAHDWCTQYIEHHDLADLQSTHAIFKMVTPAVTVRLNVGTNSQGGGELDWDGRVLPDLEFWQMDVGLHGLSLDNESLSGILGETARPVLDEDGREVMEGYEAFRGTVEDYRVAGALGTHFAHLDKRDQLE